MQLLLGFGYLAFMLALVNLVHELAPGSMGSTAQTLLTGFEFTAGTGVGELAAGHLLDLVGVQAMYAYAAVVRLVVAVSRLLNGSLSAERSVPVDS